MGRKIILDDAAAEKSKQQLRTAQELFSAGSIPKLQNAETGLSGLSYARLPNVGNVRTKADQTLQKLNSFENALNAYLQTIEQFDCDAASLIRSIPEIVEWTEHSGWNANPAVLETRIIDKLVDGGMSLEEANEFMAQYKSSLIGLSKSSVYVGDPINMSSGNFIYHKEDIRIEGVYPLIFVRFYNAVDDIVTTLGLGWTHNYNIWLKDKGQVVQIAFDDGHHEYYTKDSNGVYKASKGRFSALNKMDDAYILVTKEKLQYRFSLSGQVQAITDANNNVTHFHYKDGFLCNVSNLCGSLVFEYTKESLLHKVTDHTGRAVCYDYHGDCLIRAEQPNGAVYQYEYNRNKRIWQIKNPAGVTAISNEYDPGFRTIKQHMPDGGTLSFCYEDESLSTISTEQNGNQVTYVRDRDARTVKIVHSDSEERYEYDGDNNRTMFVDRNKNIYRYAYDNSGNIIRATDPLKNITSFSYNQFSKPIQVNNPDSSTVMFYYDDHGNLTERADPLNRLWKFNYTDNGWPVQVTLPDGSANEYTYDQRGNITSVTDAAGATIVYAYNALNQVIKSVNAEGHATWFTYNQHGDIVKSTNAMGNSCEFEYSPDGRLIRAVDYCGNETKFAYNTQGKVECVIDALGGRTQCRYDLMGNVTEYSDQEGNRTKYQYDLHNRLVAVTDPENGVMQFEHDPNGNVVAVASANGERTAIEYDAMNRAVKQIEPDGAVISYQYDSFGRLTSTSYPGNVQETREYDKAGQLIRLTNLRGETTRYTYTLLGQVLAVTSQNGDELRYEYYPGGRLKCVIKPEGETVRYVWDKNGNVVECMDAAGNRTKLEYDALDRVTLIVNPQGEKRSFSYDPMGRVTSVTDANGGIKRYRYSALGTLLEVIDANGHSTHYSYDAARRLTRIEQARMIDSDYGDIVEAETQRTIYEYNKRGNVTAIRDAMGKTLRYAYDANGRVIAKHDAEDFETAYKYNPIGQLEQTRYADGRQIQFRYGELRQLVEIRDWLGVTKLDRAPGGQVTRVTRPDGQTLGYEWTELGQRKKTIYPDGSEVAYAYNGSGRLTQVNAPGGVTHYRYDEAGRIMHREMPGDVCTDYGWDTLGRLEQLIHRKNGDILDHIQYQYDPVGNITQIEKYRAGISEDNGVFEYAYDPLNQLVEATHNGHRRKYAYDTSGNRTFSYDGDTGTRYTYNALNQLIEMRSEAGHNEYRYDRRGNLTDVFQNGNMETRYRYDAAGMLAAAVTAQNSVVEYGYDGLCNRVSKNVRMQDPEAQLNAGLQNPEESVRYFVDILKPHNNLLNMETTGGHSQNFIWGKDLLASAGDSAYTYLQDHLGSPMRLVEEGAESTPLAFDEFGVPLVAAGKDLHNPFGYTGYQADDTSGLYYAQARYYDPATSRLVAADTWNGCARMPHTQNKYAYCLNNPVTLVDRTGNWAIPSWSDILDKGAELINGCAEAFAGFMDKIPDDIVDFAKETLTPYIDAANDFLSDVAREIAPVTQTLFRYGTYASGEIFGHDNLAKWGASALNMRQDENGIYYADFDCWQRRFGYNVIYDQVFNLGTSMDKSQFKFTCNGQDFVFWAWRGDYLNLGAGAELGIYQRYQDSEHWDVDQDLAMPMSMRLIDIHGNQILGRYPEDPQWWITGFNSNELLMDAKEMIAIYTISMGDQQDMFWAFYVKYFNPQTGMARDTRLVLNPFTQMVTLTFMPEGMEDACIC